MSISRIVLKVSADASLRVTKVPKFEPDADIGQISADFERGRFEIGSDEKTVELIAISSAVANRCEHCLSVHLDKAVSLGTTEEDIFNTILISSAICETSAWAYCFMEFRKLEGKLKQDVFV